MLENYVDRRTTARRAQPAAQPKGAKRRPDRTILEKKNIDRPSAGLRSADVNNNNKNTRPI